MSNNNKLIINSGGKYQTHDENGKVLSYRAIDIEDENNIVLLDESNNTITLETQELLDKWIMISPDAILDIMITSTNIDDEIYKDVYACVYRIEELYQKNTIPDLILDQDTYSYSKNDNMGNMLDSIKVGDCFTKNYIPWLSGNIMDVCDFDEITYHYTINIYINDTLDDIFKCIPDKVLSKFNEILKELSKRNNAQINGYVDNLKALFADNDFIYHYRSIYNITQVDFPIVLGKESYNSSGDIVLNSKQLSRIQDIIKKYINNVTVIKYDRDIDLSDIVHFEHFLLSDSNEIIYLIAYEVIEPYPADQDVLYGLGQLN